MSYLPSHLSTEAFHSEVAELHDGSYHPASRQTDPEAEESGWQRFEQAGHPRASGSDWQRGGAVRICRWWPGVLIAALGGAANASWADSFTLDDGSEISGEVIQGFSHAIVVKSAGGTTVPLALDNIQLVQIDLADSKEDRKSVV